MPSDVVMLVMLINVKNGRIIESDKATRGKKKENLQC